MSLLQEFNPLLDLIRSALKAGQQCYLVGGAVRDSLLDLPVHDLDFALSGETMRIARLVSRRLNAHCYILDDDRHTGRVITSREDGSALILDFVQLIENNLEVDLRRRDFSLNAMAINLFDPDQIIDPCHGQDDLAHKILSVCSPTSLLDDPVRGLRGIRIAVQYGLQMTPETRQWMRLAFPELKRCSPERQRDELFKIFNGSRPDLALRVMDRLDGLPYVFPELVGLKGETQSFPHGEDVWEHTLSTLQQLGWLLELFRTPCVPDPYQNDLTQLVLSYLGRFQPAISVFLSERLNPDRSYLALLLLAGLYHDTGKPATRTEDDMGRIHNFRHEQVSSDLIGLRGHALVLSNAEIERLRTIIRYHMRVHFLAQADLPPSRKSIYHFFRDTSRAGIDICLLSLADTCATYGANLPEDILRAELAVISALFEAWWEKPGETVRPPVLLDGHTLIEEFHLQPGILIGRLLERIREAQAAGQVKTRGEAILFAQQWLETQQLETKDETKT
jgi:tRNA nucleotidyltransferase/poly(A) polymerase